MVSSLKDLEKLVKLMRKTGIERIEIDGIKLELGPVPEKPFKKFLRAYEEGTFVPGGIDIDTQVPEPIQTPDALTEEQLLMWSATGGQELGIGEEL